MMQLQKLTLKNYRSYESLDLQPDRHVNVLVGRNAAGKTNLLESIHYLAAGRSHRTHRDAELVRWGEQGFFISAIACAGTVRHTIECAYDDSRGKSFRLNGVAQKRLSNVIGTVNAVIFSPDDLYLIKGGPEGRRALMDTEIGQISRGYRRALARYSRVLAQRNDILKKISRSRSSGVTAELMSAPWEEQLADIGARIVAVRLVMLRRWGECAQRMYERVVDSQETLTVRYKCSFSALDGSLELSLPDLREWVREKLSGALEEARPREIERGYTLVGPQRDDLQVCVNGRDARRFASQGQQRSAILALRIGEVKWMQQETGRKPLLLLDDVMSELDAARARRLSTSVGAEGQTFITCTDLSEVDLGDTGAIWEIRDGEVTGPVK